MQYDKVKSTNKIKDQISSQIKTYFEDKKRKK